jgi:hypothetical protein
VSRTFAFLASLREHGLLDKRIGFQLREKLAAYTAHHEAR